MEWYTIYIYIWQNPQFLRLSSSLLGTDAHVSSFAPENALKLHCFAPASQTGGRCGRASLLAQRAEEFAGVGASYDHCLSPFKCFESSWKELIATWGLTLHFTVRSSKVNSTLPDACHWNSLFLQEKTWKTLVSWDAIPLVTFFRINAISKLQFRPLTHACSGAALILRSMTSKWDPLCQPLIGWTEQRRTPIRDFFLPLICASACCGKAREKSRGEIGWYTPSMFFEHALPL